MTGFLICLLFGLLIIMIIKNRNKRAINLINKIPGPSGLPLIGNLSIGLTPTHKFWDLMCFYTTTYYPTVKLWVGPYPIVFICDPADVEILLPSTKHLRKGFSYSYVESWVKTGLITSYGEKWRARRKILTPAFHSNILKKNLDIMNENAIKLIQDLKSRDEEIVLILSEMCSEHTLNIICESATGVVLDDEKNERSKKYKNAVYSMSNIVMYRALRPYITNWVLKLMRNFKSFHDETLKILHDFTKEVLEERKEHHRQTEYSFLKSVENEFNEEEPEFVIRGRKKRLALLDLLISAEKDKSIDEEGIKEELDTFMFAGHDTAATCMAYTLMLLAENENIQEKARAELTEILDKSVGKIGYSELEELKYLECCIKESLRLYPPVAMISRHITEDLQLKTYLVPAETEIFVQLYHVHRNPEYWPEPNKFDPDRFLPDRSQKRHPFSYIPFGAGPRNCIGQKFAMMELKVLIAQILYNFKLKPVDRTSNVKVMLGLLLRPTQPLRTKFIRIKK